MANIFALKCMIEGQAVHASRSLVCYPTRSSADGVEYPGCPVTSKHVITLSDDGPATMVQFIVVMDEYDTSPLGNG